MYAQRLTSVKVTYNFASNGSTSKIHILSLTKGRPPTWSSVSSLTRLEVRRPPIARNQRLKMDLSDPLTLSGDLNKALVPKFTCISYVWGKDRSPNPFHPEQLMSNNTIPSLSAAIQHSEHPAFWIDALGVPSHAPRHATLGSMGYIYSLAAEVIITCPETLHPVLSAMQSASPLPEETLHQLEQDDWVTSVWTYQEVATPAICTSLPALPRSPAATSSTVWGRADALPRRASIIQVRRLGVAELACA